MAYPAGCDGYDVVAKPLLTLVDMAGNKVATCEVVVPPRGCLRERGAPLPRGDAAARRGRTGVVRVRDTSARLYGYYFVETEGSRTIPVCHLIGG